MRQGQHHSYQTIQKIRQNALSLGLVPPSQKGRHFLNRKRPQSGLKRKPRPISYKEKMRTVMKGVVAGPKHYLWKGGITSSNNKVRTSAEYKLWRLTVFQRDNYTCQKYGTRGGDLIAHHIHNFADAPTLRLVVANGITLSEEAHNEFHRRYGKTNNTLEQLTEFLAA